MNDVPAKVEPAADNKQQIVDKIKSSTNILVTVSRDPSVDDLSAAIGLTTLLNKLGKHATAIFSGAIPPAITFLDPNKVFESTIDSLRDFIIALDKEKADHLRYKIEGDVVKIFITPYRTTITSDDLEFSQGDYNVELILALGVANQEHLDASLAAHGQILHDASVITFSAGDNTSQLGNMDWHDSEASSLSEMITNISDSLKTDKSLLDKQIATALLTGIVAATDRFSNIRTSSRVMTLAAQLMAAGADQQLIASKLQESHDIQSIVTPANNSGVITEGVPIDLNASQASTLPGGNLDVAHEPDAKADQIANIVADVMNRNNSSTLPSEDKSEAPIADNLNTAVEPSLGGALNYTTEQAAEDKQNELDDSKNKTILEHTYLGSSEGDQNSNGLIGGDGQKGEKNIDIFSENPESSTLPNDQLPAQPGPSVDTASTLPPIVVPPVSLRDSDEARAAVEAALGPQSVAPMPIPVPDLPMPPPVPDFSTLPPSALPDFNVTPPVLDTNVPVVAPPSSTDPSQFRIPGQ